MPPHCDSMSGPVVAAAREALARHDPGRVLPYVKKAGEAEVLAAFDRTIGALDGNPAANELAELYFFETVVRVHRAGEGAPYTGLKPAGTSEGPVVPVAERAIERGDPSELIGFLTTTLTAEVDHRFGEVMKRQPHMEDSVEAARAYVEAMLGLEVWSHKVYGSLTAGPHDEPSGEIHSHG